MIPKIFPSFFVLSIFAMADTNETKINGTTQQNSKFKNKLAIGEKI